MKDLLPIMKLVMSEKKDVFYSVLFAFLAGIAAVGLFASSGYLVAKAALATPLYALALVTSFLQLFGLVRAGGRYAERYFSHRATFTILSKLRVSFYEKLETRAPGIFQKYRSGDLLARIVGDVESLQNFFLRVFYPPVILVTVFLATIYFTTFISFYIAIIFFAGLLLTGFLIPALFAFRQKKTNAKVREERSGLSTETTEFLYGFRDLKIYQKMNEKESQLSEKTTRYEKEQEREGLQMMANQAIHTAVSLSISWFVLAFGAYLVTEGQLDGVFLAMLVMISLTVFENAAPMAAFPVHFEDSRKAAGRLFSVVRNEPDAPAMEQADEKRLPEEEALFLKADKLSFAFPDEKRLTLKDVSFSLPAGSKTAVVGPSGSGKSTLMQLLLKIQTPLEGSIEVGEVPLNQVRQEEIWEKTNVVLQENHFFYGTIRDNLLLAGENLTNEAMQQALEHVQLATFSLEDPVLEKGENLSGGEKQRLAIARAMLKGGRLWLLDEPASSVDALTEKMIYDHLFDAAQMDTLVLISHRLAGLEKMDHILVMDEGSLIEQGTFNELMERKGYFYHLKQLEKSILV